jgi:hypothetical protein
MRNIIAGAVAGGSNIVQIRDFEQTDIVKGQPLVPSGALCFIGEPRQPARGRIMLLPQGAIAREFGTHLREGDLSELPERRRAWDLISCSVHTIPHAIRAEQEGADMLILGTVFRSKSHPDGPTIGLEGVREVCAAVSIPVIGIGGVTAENAGDVIRAGASGVAVISAIFDADDPEAAARELRRAVDAAWAERQ